MSKKPEFRKVYHISGHLDLTEEQFYTHYVPQIEAAIQEGAAFVVGDAKGADAYAIFYLMSRGFFYNGRLTVYHMFDAPRQGEGCTQKVGGFKTDEERDNAMTANSHADIYWLNQSKAKVYVSGTYKNVLRRRKRDQVFTREQVIQLIADQANPMFHGYTCPNQDDGHHLDSGHTPLVPTIFGWVCPFCEYRQTWAMGINQTIKRTVVRDGDGTPIGMQG